MRLFLFIAVTGAIIVAGVSALAQAPFRAGVDLVELDVSVKHDDESPVSTPTPADFVVLENDVPQQIRFVSAEGHVPLALSLLVDASQSMLGSPLAQASAAAGALIDLLRPDDLVEVTSFNDHAHLLYPMGADHGVAKSALSGISAGGATALYEAVLVAVHNQEHARRNRSAEYREVIVVLSDGENTAGHVAFDSVLDRVRRSGAMVYTIATASDARSRVASPRWEMAELAFDTGGQAVSSREPEGLTRIYQDIAQELLHLYRLGYVPVPLAHDGSWRRVAVRAAGKGVVVRARSGYYAPDAAGRASRETPPQ